MKKKQVFRFDFSPPLILQQEKLRSNNGFFSNPFGTSNGDHRSGQASRDAVSTNNTRGSGRCDTSASTIGSTGTVVSETFELNGEYSTAQRRTDRYYCSIISTTLLYVV